MTKEHLTKAHLYDDEILETSKRIQRLIESDSPFHELEALREKLSGAIENKRQNMYRTIDASYFVDQYFRAPTREARLGRANELAEEALSVINTVMEGTGEYDSVDFEELGAIVDFFRFICAQTANIEADEEDLDDEELFELRRLTREDQELDYAFASKVSTDALIEALVDADYLTKENGRLFASLIKRKDSDPPSPVPIKWNKTVHSLGNLLCLLVQLNLLRIEYQKNPKREDGKEAGGRETTAAFIWVNFDFRSLPIRTFYRYVKEAKEDIEGMFSQIEKERKRHAEARGLPYFPIERTNCLLHEYYTVIEYRGAGQRIHNASEHLDTQILQILHDFLNRSGDDEQ